MSDEILFEMNRTLGRIEEGIKNNALALTNHIADDKATSKFLFERLETMQASANKQKGALTVLGALGSMLGAGIGYLAERFIRGH